MTQAEEFEEALRVLQERLLPQMRAALMEEIRNEARIAVATAQQGSPLHMLDPHTLRFTDPKDAERIYSAATAMDRLEMQISDAARSLSDLEYRLSEARSRMRREDVSGGPQTAPEIADEHPSVSVSENQAPL